MSDRLWSDIPEPTYQQVKPWPRNRIVAWWWRRVLGRRILFGFDPAGEEVCAVSAWYSKRTHQIHLIDLIRKADD